MQQPEPRPRRNPGPRAALWAVGATVVAASVGTGTVGERQQAGELPILQEPAPTQYRALRRMHAVNDKFQAEAWMEVWTELDAKGFRFEIVSERGSEYLRTKVLTKMLLQEQEIVTKGETERADLSSGNYEFTDGGGQAEGVRYVLLKPKRKDILLVDGRMVVNNLGTELFRIEGTLAKNPSFWMNTVQVVRDFARFDGVRVPVSVETFATMKFAGRAQLDVKYEYQTINGRAVQAEVLASGLQSAPGASTRQH